MIDTKFTGRIALNINNEPVKALRMKEIKKVI